MVSPPPATVTLAPSVTTGAPPVMAGAPSPVGAAGVPPPLPAVGLPASFLAVGSVLAASARHRPLLLPAFLSPPLVQSRFGDLLLFAPSCLYPIHLS